MSPEIRINGKVLADVPDQTGHYQTLGGDPLYVNVDGIDPANEVQQIILQTERLAGQPGRTTETGRRVIELNPHGTGSQMLSGGDQLSITLHDRPIRKTVYAKREVNRKSLGNTSGSITVWEPARTNVHPRWQKGHGAR